MANSLNMNATAAAATEDGSPRYRVLVAEDDPVFRRILTVWLAKWGFETDIAKDGNEAWRLLQRRTSPGITLLDWMMPGIDGVELCRKIRRRGKGDQDPAYEYIVLLTAKTEREDVVRGLAAGADDCVPKPVDPEQLRSRLRVGLRILDLQDRLIRARETLREQSLRDALTGLWNRRAILDILQKELERWRRSGIPLAILMIDVDRFKRINDTYGHLVGDRVLQEVVERISASIRSYDALGRYGGEEFLAVLPGADSRLAAEVGERLRATVAETAVPCRNCEVGVTISVGCVAICEPHAGIGPISADDLLHSADTALYAAKASGRNCLKAAAAVDTSTG